MTTVNTVLTIWTRIVKDSDTHFRLLFLEYLLHKRCCNNTGSQNVFSLMVDGKSHYFVVLSSRVFVHCGKSTWWIYMTFYTSINAIHTLIYGECGWMTHASQRFWSSYKLHVYKYQLLVQLVSDLNQPYLNHDIFMCKWITIYAYMKWKLNIVINVVLLSVLVKWGMVLWCTWLGHPHRWYASFSGKNTFLICTNKTSKCTYHIIWLAR